MYFYLGNKHTRGEYLAGRKSGEGPSTLFRKAPAVNSRLLYGTTRSAAQSGSNDEYEDNDWLPEQYLLRARKYDEEHQLRTGASLTALPLPTLQQRVNQIKKQRFEGVVYSEYSKWRTTLPDRWGGLLKQFEAERPDGHNSRPIMREILRRRFTTLQLRRLRTFQQVHPRLENNIPWYVPQYYGGLGLPRDLKDKVPAIEHAAVLAMSRLSPQKRNKVLNVIQPRIISSTFMHCVTGELSELKDSLEIEDEYIPAEEIGLLRFGDRPDSFWEQEILNGFCTDSNLTISAEEIMEAVPHLNIGWVKIIAQQSSTIWQGALNDVRKMKGCTEILRDNGRMGISGEVTPEKIWENGLRLKRVSPMPRLE